MMVERSRAWLVFPQGGGGWLVQRGGGGGRCHHAQPPSMIWPAGVAGASPGCRVQVWARVWCADPTGGGCLTLSEGWLEGAANWEFIPAAG